jgi:5'-deoxynucleotidase YfbR-like HD superfamily hydrolase
MHIALIWDPYSNEEAQSNKTNYEKEKIADLKQAISEFREFEGEGSNTGLMDQIFNTESRLSYEDFIKKVSSKELSWLFNK